MVLLVISLTTISSVQARTLTVSDSDIVPTNVLDTFKGFYDWEFTFLPYKCTYNTNERTCYFAFDKEGNYVDITYQNINNYSYDYKISKGTDNDINIIGNSLVWVNWFLVCLVTIVFIIGTIFIFKLIVGDI